MIKTRELKFMEPVGAGKGDGFGDRNGTHYGIDYPADRGTVVMASEGGTVVRGSFNSTYGYLVIINHTPSARKHERHIYTLYAHLSRAGVSGGQKVKKGDTVGYVGNTGETYSTSGGDGIHLHFEVIDSDEEMKWGIAGPTQYENKKNRKDPTKGYLGSTITIEYPCTEEEMAEIRRRVTIEPRLTGGIAPGGERPKLSRSLEFVIKVDGVEVDCMGWDKTSTKITIPGALPE